MPFFCFHLISKFNFIVIAIPPSNSNKCFLPAGPKNCLLLKTNLIGSNGESFSARRVKRIAAAKGLLRWFYDRDINRI